MCKVSRYRGYNNAVRRVIGANIPTSTTPGILYGIIKDEVESGALGSLVLTGPHTCAY